MIKYEHLPGKWLIHVTLAIARPTNRQLVISFDTAEILGQLFMTEFSHKKITKWIQLSSIS